MAYETPIRRFPYNAVFRFRVDGRSADAEIDRLLTGYQRRQAPLAWVVHPTAEPDDLRARLTRRGFARGELVRGMTRSLADLPPLPEPPPGIEVFEGAAAEARDWLHLVSWRYDLAEDVTSTLADLYRMAIDQDPRRATRWWGARRAGLPLSKVVLHVSERVAGIYGVATIEAGRGLGLAGLLTLAALHAAQQSGCRFAVLHATPMAVRLYERLGFQHSAEFEVWSEPGQTHL